MFNNNDIQHKKDMDAINIANEKNRKYENKKQLNDLNQQLESIERSGRGHNLADFSWRPAWTTAQLVVMVNILYNQRNILSKTISKICNAWPERKNSLDEEGYNWLKIMNDSKNLSIPETSKVLQPYMETDNLPNYKDLQSGLKENELVQFPFKDRVEKRKKERGLK